MGKEFQPLTRQQELFASNAFTPDGRRRLEGDELKMSESDTARLSLEFIKFLSGKISGIQYLIFRDTIPGTTEKVTQS